MLVTRRSFLESASTLTLGTALAPGISLALEEHPLSTGGKPTLVVVFLRGGMDGLNLIVPHADEAYYDLRPNIAIPRPGAQGGALDLDGRFGLHPAAAALAPLFDEGLAVALHAVGHARNTRSHFLEQDLWETAVADHGLATAGWLNRHLATSRGRGPVRALALGNRLPRSLRGTVQALALRGLSDLTLPGDSESLEATLKAMRRSYGGSQADAGASGLLSRAGTASLDALRQLQAVAARPYTPVVEFPDTDLGRRCAEASRLIKSDLGLELVELDLGGWDTHQGQGGVAGTFADNLRQLSEALAAMVRDLQERLDDVLIVTLTEFGRTAAQNGTNGTDHGWASCSLILGGPLRPQGGRPPRKVLGRWPGLAPEELNQGRDLAHTTDFRDLYAECLGFLGNSELERVLPGHEVRPVGLLREA